MNNYKIILFFGVLLVNNLQASPARFIANLMCGKNRPSFTEKKLVSKEAKEPSQFARCLHEYHKTFGLINPESNCFRYLPALRPGPE